MLVVKKHIFSLVLLSSLGLLADGKGVVVPAEGLAGTNLVWKIDKGCRQYVRLQDGVLTVDVPKGVSNVCAYATAELDLSNFDRSVFEATVKAKAEDVVVDPRPARGLKVSLHYADALSGGMHYDYDKRHMYGSFGWTNCTLRVQFGELPPAAKPTPKLVLGIQQTSGKAVFDLKTLVVRKGEPLFPSDDTDRQVAYPPEFAALPPLRGVMALGCRRTTEKDVADLHRMGATLVRLQMNGFLRKGDPNWRPTLAMWNDWFAKWLVHADEVLGWLEARGMKMALDMHNPPAGGYGDKCPLFDSAEMADRFVSAWEEIARRYKGRKGLYGYDLVNEPAQTDRALPDCDYWNVQRRAAEAIRRIDPDATIVVESNEWDSPSAFSYLKALDLDNVVYQAHMYAPGWFTHQGANGKAIPKPEDLQAYPSTKKKIDRDYLRRVLKPVREFQRRHGCRILIGEFSAALYAPGAAEYLSDCIDLFHEYGWDWTYHSFREARYWNVETTLDGRNRNVPNVENPRYFALTSGFKPTLPVKVAGRTVKLETPSSSGLCTAVAELGNARRIRFAALAAVEFDEDREIDRAVTMTVRWTKPDGSELRCDAVGFSDYLEQGRRYRAFEDKLNVPPRAGSRAWIILEAKGAPGEFRFSGIRAQKLR